jgi:hypothetical protein
MYWWTLLSGGLGHARPLTTHKGGCYLDPNGTTSVGMAFCLELQVLIHYMRLLPPHRDFKLTCDRLPVAHGLSLNLTQDMMCGAPLGPLLVGVLVDIIQASIRDIDKILVNEVMIRVGYNVASR